MKISPDAIIPEAKLTEYLLILQPRNDKSKFLAQAGFTLDNPADLLAAIRSIIAINEAIFDRTDEYGTFYRVTGVLMGVNGTNLGVVTTVPISSVEALHPDAAIPNSKFFDR